jgi:hypothetical protein
MIIMLIEKTYFPGKRFFTHSIRTGVYPIPSMAFAKVKERCRKNT